MAPRLVGGATPRRGSRIFEIALFLRGLLFIGMRFRCPCCGWSLRDFTRGGPTIRRRDQGYCPRCNSKARHRRIWLFLEDRTNLFTERLRLLEVAPKYSFSRRFIRMPNLTFIGVDLVQRTNCVALMDLTDACFRNDAFDAAICVHVLEEICDDGSAMRELHRVLRPGGWALVSVPTRMGRPTYEDPSIVDPKERQRAFGEKAHVRVYGRDIVERLENAGFTVEAHLAADVRPAIRDRYGLRDDENIFYCRKPP